MSKSYKKKKSGSWTKVFQDTFQEFFCGLNKKMLFVNSFPRACNKAARICIYTLIGVTLLFSGLGFYSWIILIMLIIVLQFV